MAVELRLVQKGKSLKKPNWTAPPDGGQPFLEGK